MGQQSSAAAARVGLRGRCLPGCCCCSPPFLHQAPGSAASPLPGVPIRPHAAAAVCRQARAPCSRRRLLVCRQRLRKGRERQDSAVPGGLELLQAVCRASCLLGPLSSFSARSSRCHYVRLSMDVGSRSCCKRTCSFLPAFFYLSFSPFQTFPVKPVVTLFPTFFFFFSLSFLKKGPLSSTHLFNPVDFESLSFHLGLCCIISFFPHRNPSSLSLRPLLRVALWSSCNNINSSSLRKCTKPRSFLLTSLLGTCLSPFCKWVDSCKSSNFCQVLQGFCGRASA